jgi:hypothetical protein
VRTVSPAAFIEEVKEWLSQPAGQHMAVVYLSDFPGT